MPADPDEFRQPGRWILSPKRGSRFVGVRARERQRARERRRRIYLLLIEAIALTGLIGVFPPLRGMLFVTGFFVLVLAAYTGLVVWFTSSGRAAAPAVVSVPEAEPTRPTVVRLPELAKPDPALEEQDRRLVRVAR